MDHIANEQAPGTSSQNEADEHLIFATKSLRRHCGLADVPGEKSTIRKPDIEPFFWIEVAPPSVKGAKCQLDCGKKITPGEYRIAVNPGQYSYYSTANSDYYHVHCFEKIADFSQAEYLDRVQPLTRNVTKLRNLKGTSILDGNYLLDAGAERLCLEWKITVGALIDKRDGVEVTETMDPDFNDLLRKSGSAKYVPKMYPGMTTFEYMLLTSTLAPFESDGMEDEEEWNLFEEFLTVSGDRSEDLEDRHSLSDMLEDWRKEVILATSDNLTEHGKELKGKMSPKAIRAIERLAVTPMPDLQSAFRRGHF
ncbi:hypothetical protein BDZ45DRAFT_688807 [Acephala macrosclerotiorum]|nr:hypothetical protein BDZ45DRAFT_688807 [Acephala macrosclerotiorum]